MSLLTKLHPIIIVNVICMVFIIVLYVLLKTNDRHWSHRFRKLIRSITSAFRKDPPS